VLPASLLAMLAMFSFRVGFGVLNAAVPVMSIQELGWTDTGYSQVRAIAELAGALIGMALGGVLIDRIGRVRMATAAGAFAIALMLAMAWVAPFWSLRSTIIVFVTGYAIVSTTLLILLAAIMMPLCGTRCDAVRRLHGDQQHGDVCWIWPLRPAQDAVLVPAALLRRRIQLRADDPADAVRQLRAACGAVERNGTSDGNCAACCGRGAGLTSAHP